MIKSMSMKGTRYIDQILVKDDLKVMTLCSDPVGVCEGRNSTLLCFTM